MIEILHTSLAFVVAIALLIAVHEYGHFSMARRLGIKVEKFSIGFGPALFSWRSKDQEVLYVIAAIPLGGYVKMLGENPDQQGDGQAQLSEQDKARAFNNQAIWKRAAVAVAGPGYNFIFAIVAYMIIGWMGQSVLPTIVGHVAPASVAERSGLRIDDRIVSVAQQPVHSWQQMEEQLKHKVGASTTLQVQRDEQMIELRVQLPTQDKDALLMDVADEVLGFNPGLTVRIDDVVDGSAAQRGGVQTGDIIKQINGWPVSNMSQLIEKIKAKAEQPVNLVVQRDHSLLQLQVTPVADQNNQGRLGVKLAAQAIHGTEMYRMGVWDGLIYGFTRTWDITALTLNVFGKMVTASISPDNLGGPIAIAQLAGKTAEMGLVYFIGFLALISVNLGVLNLLPIPILDGGLLVYLAIEKVMGKPLSAKAMEISQMMGLMLIISLMVFAFYNDISRLFRG
ncbi:MAG: RIP metalloprotease RseP [Mariprofundus sp.]|nr:RIP metalloprotease RseP [Mariprofundus sp.]